MDSESYVHRIGRTGRAGRAGRALLFVENRERRLLRNIERTMKLTIPEVELPNAELLSKRRLEKFAAKVQQQLESSIWTSTVRCWRKSSRRRKAKSWTWKRWLPRC